MKNWIENLPEMPRLSRGGHNANSNKACAMELVAFMERLPHSDRPECTCPILSEYVRTLNDKMPDDRRQDLLPILPRLVGTVNPEIEQKRAEFFAMRTATHLVPIVLDGVINSDLVAAMREARSLEDAHAAAAYAAADAADAAAACAAAYAADAAAADAADAAAAYAAACAADAAAACAASTPGLDFWGAAIQMLIDAIELDPAIKPAQWDEGRILEAVKEFS